MKPIGPDTELINRAFRIKPVIRLQDGFLHFVEPSDLYEKIYGSEGFYPAARADSHVQKIAEIDIKVPATLWGGAVSSPTLAQVLAQIPPEFLEQTVAVSPHMTDDTQGDNGYAQARVELYGGTLPDKIKQQTVTAWHKEYTKPFPEPEPQAPKFNAAAATTLGEDVQVMKPIELKRKPLPPTIIK